MLYLIQGPDQFRARAELNKIRSSLDREGNLAHNTVWLDGRGLTPAELQAACHTHSFFAEDRLVVVEGLQSRLAGSSRRGRRPSAPTVADPFIEVLAHLPETTTAVLLDDSFGPLPEALPGAKVMRFEYLKKDGLLPWARERASSSGAEFAAGALEQLTSMVDTAHLGELANEIDKLATYANGRKITKDDVRVAGSSALQLFGYQLTDAIVDGRADRAFKVLDSMDVKSWPPVRLLATIRYAYRGLILAQALLAERRSEAEIGSATGLRGYPLEKTIGSASRYRPGQLEDSYRRILKADVDVKTGVMDAETVLPALIAELTELSRSSRPSPTSAR
jgi:DNA polymerase-3 subunit delta